MLLTMRSVHFTSPPPGLSAFYNVLDVRAGCRNGRSPCECDISARMNVGSRGFTTGAQFDWGCVETDRRPSALNMLCVQFWPPESVAASIWPGSHLLSSSVFINSPFVAPAPRRLPPLLTRSARPNAADEPLMYRWASSFSPIKPQHFLCFHFNCCFFFFTISGVIVSPLAASLSLLEADCYMCYLVKVHDDSHLPFFWLLWDTIRLPLPIR